MSEYDLGMPLGRTARRSLYLNSGNRKTYRFERTETFDRFYESAPPPGTFFGVASCAEIDNLSEEIISG